MRIIITGASGFVGQNLSTYLQAKEVNTQSVSLRNTLWTKEIKTNADAVIHLAGKAHDISNTSVAEEYLCYYQKYSKV